MKLINITSRYARCAMFTQLNFFHLMGHYALLLTFIFRGLLVNAQSGTVTNAVLYRQSGELDKAKSKIDEACLHEKTSMKTKTWYYKGWIYMDIYTTDKAEYKNLANNPGEIAYEAFKKIY